MKRVCLLTGRPGTGKTSLVKQAVAELECRAGGFYTEEMRSRGIRLGFRLVTLDGRETVLAHIDFSKRHRVGKYGVDIEGFDRIGVTALLRAAEHGDLVVVDEIGKMEMTSADFRGAISGIIAGGKAVLGTIMLNSNPWADSIKCQPQVNLITVTRDNRSQVLNGIRNWLETVESLICPVF